MGLSWRNLLNNGINLVVNKMYSFIVGKISFMQNLNLEPPPAKYACSDSHYFSIALQCEIASTFNILTYMAAMSHVAGFL